MRTNYFIGIPLLFALIFTNQKLNAQITRPANNDILTPAIDYVGWDNSMTGISLKIKTESTDPINFYTSAGAGGFANMRMTITGAGNVGIGNLATPNTLLHLHQAAANTDVNFQMTNNTTGNGITDLK